MAENDTHRDLGRLEGRIGALESQLAEHRTGVTLALADTRADFKTGMADLKKSLDAITAHMNTDDVLDAQRMGAVKGAWWVVGLVAAALISIGGTLGVILRSGFK